MAAGTDGEGGIRRAWEWGKMVSISWRTAGDGQEWRNQFSASSWERRLARLGVGGAVAWRALRIVAVPVRGVRVWRCPVVWSGLRRVRCLWPPNWLGHKFFSLVGFQVCDGLDWKYYKLIRPKIFITVFFLNLLSFLC